MKFRLPRLALVALLIAAAAGLPPVARGQTFFAVGKVQSFSQTGAGLLAPYAGDAFEFDVLCSFPGSVTFPSGENVPLVYATNVGFYETTAAFNTQAEMDAAYPAGSYVIDAPGDGTPTLKLPADEFPPEAQVIGGTWNASGQLQIDPTASYTFNFSPFASYVTAGVNAEVIMTIRDSLGVAVANQVWLREEDVFSDTYTLQPGMLAAGQTYSVSLNYYIFTSSDSTTVPGSYVEVLFGSFTYFTIATSSPAASSLVVVTEPTSETVANGTTAVLTFLATGSPSPSYQWYFNGLPIQATGSSLVITGATQVNAGTYYCVASNGTASVQSSPATLAVSANPDRGRLVNISCRAQVGTGANILIAGFAVGGAGTSGTQSLLLRGSGPALAGFGVTGTLPDPQLQIYTGATLLQSNTSWMGAAAISMAAAEVGAFAYTVPSSHDAALLASLSQGAYTAQVSGEAGDSGVALAEIYDTTKAGAYTPSSPRIVNISARVQVGTGGNILIAGFVIGGATSETVLIRASGPALAGFGVAGTLPDPQLQLYSGQTVLGEDVGWTGSTQIANIATSVGAFAWTTGSSGDSALLVTLPPGAYTAQVAGLSGDTGVALIEVYEVP